MKIMAQEEILGIEGWGPEPITKEFKFKRKKYDTCVPSEISEKPKIIRDITKDIKNVKKRISLALHHPVVKVQLTREMFFDFSGFLERAIDILAQIIEEEIEYKGKVFNIPDMEVEAKKVQRLLEKIRYVVDDELVNLDTGMNRRDKYFKLLGIYPNRTNLYDSGFATENTVIFHDDGINIDEQSVLVNCQIHGSFGYPTDINDSYLENCTVAKGCTITSSIIKLGGEIDRNYNMNLISCSKIDDSMVMAGDMLEFHIERTSVRSSMIKLREDTINDIFTLDDMIISASRIINTGLSKDTQSKFQGIDSNISSGVFNNICQCFMKRTSISRSLFSDLFSDCGSSSTTVINMKDVGVQCSRLINPKKDEDVVFNLTGYKGAKYHFLNMILTNEYDLHTMRVGTTVFTIYPSTFFEKKKKCLRKMR